MQFRMLICVSRHQMNAPDRVDSLSFVHAWIIIDINRGKSTPNESLNKRPDKSEFYLTNVIIKEIKRYCYIDIFSNKIMCMSVYTKIKYAWFYHRYLSFVYGIPLNTLNKLGVFSTVKAHTISLLLIAALAFIVL